MSLLAQAKIAQDTNLIQRIAACAAVCGVPDSPPTGWALREIWVLAATEGWAQAYADCTSPTPGACPDSITDQMILAAVQARIAQIEAERPPTPEYPEDSHPAE